MTSAKLVQCSYQLSYQANWELVTLLVRNIPVDGVDLKEIYEISYIQLVKALDWYRSGHGMESRSNLIFFKALFFQLLVRTAMIHHLLRMLFRSSNI